MLHFKDIPRAYIGGRCVDNETCIFIRDETVVGHESNFHWSSVDVDSKNVCLLINQNGAFERDTCDLLESYVCVRGNFKNFAPSYFSSHFKQ